MNSQINHLTRPLNPRHFVYDVTQNFDVNWNGGSAYRSQIFNAISMSLPVAERWIIDTVRRVIEILPPDLQSEWSSAAKDFIAQESNHRSVHRLHNAQLVSQGIPNWIDAKVQRRSQWGEKGTPLNKLASSVAYEYLAGIYGSAMLKSPSWLEGAAPQLAQMWRWHICEELEHKYFVYDLYIAAGGGSLRRVAWYLWALSTFMLDLHCQLFLALRATGELWRFKTVLQGLKFNFGKGGMFWCALFGSVQFLSPRFRLTDGPIDKLASQWLANSSSDIRSYRDNPNIER